MSETNSQPDTASVAINWQDSPVTLIGGLPGVDAAEAWRLRTDIPFPAAPDRSLWRLYRPDGKLRNPRSTDRSAMFGQPKRCPGVYLIDPAEWGVDLMAQVTVGMFGRLYRTLEVAGDFGPLVARAVVNRVDGDLVANMRAPILMRHRGVLGTQVILAGEHRFRHPLIKIGGDHAATDA